jgi:ABC-type uncharacterized transport system involved in gliding motility auxiliary subunit
MQRLRALLPPFLLASGLLALAIAVGLFLVLGELNRYVLTAVALGAVLLIAYFLERPEAVTTVLTRRQTKYGTNTAVMILAFLGILVVLNAVAARRPLRYDLTEAKEFTLSPQSVQIVQQLQTPVKITAFYRPGDFGYEQLNDLLKEYQRHTDKIQVEFVDPELKPGVAAQYNIQSYGTTVVEANGKRQMVFGAAEGDITSAILKVTRAESKKVYFLTGHGELDPDAFDRTGASAMKRILQQDNYQVEKLNLATTGRVPTDAAVVIVAGPQRPLLDSELQALRDYLEKGGKALILVEPRTTHNLTDLLARWGVEIGNGIVVEPAQGLAGDPLVPTIVRYTFHPITRNLTGVASVFVTATSVTMKKDRPQNLTITPLFQTTDRSWLETDPQIARFDEGQDIRGPLTLAVAVQATDQPTGGEQSSTDQSNRPHTRLVIVGDRDFASDEVVTRLGGIANADLFANAVNWLAEEEALISVHAKPPATRPLLLTGAQANFILLTSVVFFPLLILLAGAWVWWQRR